MIPRDTHHCRCVRDISLNKCSVAWHLMALSGCKVVDDNDLAPAGNQSVSEVAADETCSAGNYNRARN